MSLTNVLNIAQNSLANLTRQTAVLSRNVNDANTSNYARRELQIVTNSLGTQTTTVRRATDNQLERVMYASVSANSGQELYLDRLDALSRLVTDESGALQIAADLNALQDAIQTFSAGPDNLLLAEAAVGRAKAIVTSLNEDTQALSRFRSDIDKEIGSIVSELNGLVAAFGEVNADIVQGTKLGIDTNDALDRRAELLESIARITPVTPVPREYGDLVLLTGSGTTLFETVPRRISFTEATSLGPGVSGNTVQIDFVAVNFEGNGISQIAGSLEGLLRIRDEVVPKLQSQLDETARTLLSAFAETDNSGSGLPPLQGLFTWPGGPALPPTGSIVHGLAGNIAVNSAYDLQAGGTPILLRDGGSNGVAYSANPAGYPAFADRLIVLAEQFTEEFTFEPDVGFGSDMTIGAFVARSSAWISGQRSSATSEQEKTEAKLSRVREAYSNQTGVNVDAEMIKLGELENGYLASARLLNTADQMLQSLLEAVG